MKSMIYYFSGTGNSLKVAKDVAEGIDAEIIKICDKTIESDATSYDKIGIVFPVYMSGTPLLVKDFIRNLKIPNNTYIFTIVTFGGAAAASISQVETLLNDKSIKLSAAFKVKMPGNFQVMYSPFSQEAQKKCFEEEQKSVIEIVRSITQNEVNQFTGTGPKLANKLGTMVQNLYFKPYEADKNFWVDENCNGCGTCSKVCPVHNINMDAGTPTWEHRCEQCLACMQWCPKKSIQYKKATIKRGRYHHPEIKVQELFNR